MRLYQVSMRYHLVLLVFVFLTGLLSTQVVKAQDPLFSQYYAAPLYLNPALTGGFTGRYRVSAIYRDQWRSPLEQAISTFGAGLDLRFDMQGKALAGDAAAVGIQFVTDQAGSLNLSTNSISLSGAFHKSLDIGNRQYLSAGFQFSAFQRNILYKNLTFQDQFNGVDDFTGSTAEDLPANNYGFGDISFGLNYAVSIHSSLNLYLGATAHHLTQPEISFYAKDEDEDQQEVSNSPLYRKYGFHAGLTTDLSENVKISPRTYFTSQGSHLSLSLGNVFILEPSSTDEFNFHLGAWISLVRDFDNAIQPNAVGLLAGMGFGNLLVGLSYDFNIRDIINYQTGQGSFEISITYSGDYEDEGGLCPTF